MTVLNGFIVPGIPLGWSPLGGQITSAFGPEQEVWGSSTGSAVAVSAGMCPLALGVESHGSIVRCSILEVRSLPDVTDRPSRESRYRGHQTDQGISQL